MTTVALAPTWAAAQATAAVVAGGDTHQPPLRARVGQR